MVVLHGLKPGGQFNLFENHFDQAPTGFWPVAGTGWGGGEFLRGGFHRLRDGHYDRARADDPRERARRLPLRQRCSRARARRSQ